MAGYQTVAFIYPLNKAKRQPAIVFCWYCHYFYIQLNYRCMKNTIVVLIALLLSMPVFAQPDPWKPINTLFNNDLFHPKLKSVLGSSKNNHFFLLSNRQQFNLKHFLEIYRPHQVSIQTSQRRVTFMNGPVMFPSLPADMSRSSSPSYQGYPPTNPSAALTILGMVGGIVAGAVYPSYMRNTYHNNGTAVEAYLQSTYYQHYR
jgi:hypothetical protein